MVEDGGIGEGGNDVRIGHVEQAGVQELTGENITADLRASDAIGAALDLGREALEHRALVKETSAVARAGIEYRKKLNEAQAAITGNPRTLWADLPEAVQKTVELADGEDYIDTDKVAVQWFSHLSDEAREVALKAIGSARGGANFDRQVAGMTSASHSLVARFAVDAENQREFATANASIAAVVNDVNGGIEERIAEVDDLTEDYRLTGIFTTAQKEEARMAAVKAIDYGRTQLDIEDVTDDDELADLLSSARDRGNLTPAQITAMRRLGQEVLGVVERAELREEAEMLEAAGEAAWPVFYAKAKAGAVTPMELAELKGSVDPKTYEQIANMNEAVNVGKVKAGNVEEYALLTRELADIATEEDLLEFEAKATGSLTASSGINAGQWAQVDALVDGKRQAFVSTVRKNAEAALARAFGVQSEEERAAISVPGAAANAKYMRQEEYEPLLIEFQSRTEDGEPPEAVKNDIVRRYIGAPGRTRLVKEAIIRRSAGRYLSALVKAPDGGTDIQASLRALEEMPPESAVQKRYWVATYNLLDELDRNPPPEVAAPEEAEPTLPGIEDFSAYRRAELAVRQYLTHESRYMLADQERVTLDRDIKKEEIFIDVATKVQQDLSDEADKIAETALKREKLARLKLMTEGVIDE